ncbi:MAG: iron-containing alcohol dehydrogenase [Bacteroidia bacterium]|nr:iron-containing alcohol dehydrogenase [Bacteroidia bacterium]
MKFSQYCPTRVHFGEGIINNILDYIPKSTKSILLVSSKSAAEKSGALKAIKTQAQLMGLKLQYRNTISPNPRVDEIDALAEVCQELGIDCLISVGGGSVIDATKFLSIRAPVQKSAKDILSGNEIEAQPLFHMAVPTTAGTGSEVSKGAIVSDPVNNWKGGLRGEKLFPKIALLDPELTKSLPKSIAIETGFDVLTHSLESYVSKASTPITRMYSREAIKRAVPALLKQASNTADANSRSELMYASLLAGYNLANASTCLPHRLQYPLGARTDCPHARGLAALYPAWIKKTYDFKPEPFNFFADTITNCMELKEKFKSEKEHVVQIVNKFLATLEINHSLSDFGVTKKDCDLYVSEIQGNLKLDPGMTDNESLKQIYLESL